MEVISSGVGLDNVRANKRESWRWSGGNFYELFESMRCWNLYVNQIQFMAMKCDKMTIF